MSPRPRKPSEPILEAAVQLMAEHGVDGVSLDAVAAAAGVSKTTLYRRWPTRAALIHDAVHSLDGAVADPDTGSVRDDLVALLEQLAVYLGDRDGRVYLTFLDASARDPDLDRLRSQAERRILDLYARVVDRGIARGELPDRIDAALLIDLLIGTLVYRQIVRRAALERADIGALVDHVIDGFVGGGRRDDDGRGSRRMKVVAP